MSQLLNIQWDNFPSLVEEFKNFLSTETMVDITLVCDGRRLKAHKLILSACSPLLKTLLTENPCKHPIIILQDMKFSAVEAVIDLIYKGQTERSAAVLPDILKTAKTLEIKILEEVITAAVESEHCNGGFEIQPDAAANPYGNETENTYEKGAVLLPRTSPASVLQSKERYFSNTDHSEKYHQTGTGDLRKELHLHQRSILDNSKKGHQTTTDLSNKKKVSRLDHSKKQHQSRSLVHSKEGHKAMNDYCRKNQSKSIYLDSKEQQHESPNDSSKKHLQSSADCSKEHNQSSSCCSKKHYQVSPNKHQQSSPDHTKQKFQNTLDMKQHPNNIEHLYKQQHQSNPEQSDDKQHQNSPGHSIEKLTTLIPSPTLPIILIEKMKVVDDSQHITPPPGTPKYHSSKDEENVELQNEKLQTPSSENEGNVEFENGREREESENENGVEELENEELKEAKELNREAVLKNKKKLKKIKRPYVKTPIAVREAYFKIEESPSGMKFYGCKECSFTTKYSESLKRHIFSKHQKSRRYKCDKCSYAATLKQHLKRHKMEVHERVQRFECQLCPYKAVQKSALMRHMECVHEQKKPFMCEECGFRSSQKVNVRKHILAIHEKKRDFACHLCTYRCAQSGGLKRHIRLVHEKV